MNFLDGAVTEVGTHNIEIRKQIEMTKDTLQEITELVSIKVNING